MAADPQTLATVLACVPQQHPFRFIDAILALDTDTIVSTCTFSEDAFFYAGHFPGRPITPGVILIETMAQSGVVALGIYQLLQQGYGPDRIGRITPLFAFADQVEFSEPVLPGAQVTVRAEKQYYRRGTIKSRATLENDTGKTICSALLTGAGVQIDAT